MIAVDTSAPMGGVPDGSLAEASGAVLERAEERACGLLFVGGDVSRAGVASCL